MRAVKKKKKKHAPDDAHAALSRRGFPRKNEPKGGGGGGGGGCCWQECHFPVLEREHRSPPNPFLHTHTRSAAAWCSRCCFFSMSGRKYNTQTCRRVWPHLCGNYNQDKLTLGTTRACNHLFILWQIDEDSTKVYGLHLQSTLFF